MDRLRLLGTFSILLIAGSLPLPTFANVCVYKPPTVGHIHGRIMDLSDYPIPDAQVIVMRGEETVQTILTRKTWEFNFESLPPGKYEIDVTARGFQHAQYILRLSSRKNRKQVLRITLRIGSIYCDGSIQVVEEKPAQH